MTTFICSRTLPSPLTVGLHPRARVFALSSLPHLLFSALPQPAATDSHRSSVTIDNPGSTQGLRAKFGRFFSFSGSGSARSSSPPAVTYKNQISDGFRSPTEDVSEEQQQQGTKWGDSQSAGEAMQTLYISHGSPMLPIQHDAPARDFIIGLGSQVERPKAVLIISAHWDTTEPTVTAGKMNDTIYDFYGFPKELYKIKYNCPGDPELAERVVGLLREGGFPKAKKNEKRGLDHGAWVPLLMMYPEKDIPIVQLSVQYRKDGAHHYKVGQALRALKNEGVLVIGSGSATHNLGEISFDGGALAPWAVAFDNWLNDALTNNRYEEVMNFKEKAPYARKAHPTPDHFLPAIVALGAAGQDAVGERIHSGWALGTISMASFAFNAPPAVVAAA